MAEHPDIMSLISRYFDDDLDEASVRELQDWINESKQNALLFVRMSYNNQGIRHCLVAQDLTNYADQSRNSMDESGRFLLDLMQIETRLQASIVDATDLIEDRKRPGAADRDHHAGSSMRLPIRRGPRVIVIPYWMVYAAAALVFLSLIGGFYAFYESAPDIASPTPEQEERTPAPATTRLAVLYQVDPATGQAGGKGRDLFAGDRVSAEQAGALVKLDSGATVQLSAHAEFEVSAANRGRLVLGQLMGVVPPEAAGFEVEVPTGLVRDLGTEFTVALDQAGVSQVRVLKGSVSIHKRDDEDQVLSGHTLSQGQVGLISPAEEELFVIRDVPLGVMSTGAASAPGLTDLHWSVVALSDVPDYRPEPAMVVVGELGRQGQRWAPNSIQSMWLVQGTEQAHAPQGRLTTFSHRFTIPEGADYAAIRLRASVWADDYLESVTLNGQELLPADYPKIPGSNYNEPYRLVIDRGFVAGENVLEIVVCNDDETKAEASPTGLRVEFTPVRIRVPIAASATP